MVLHISCDISGGEYGASSKPGLAGRTRDAGPRSHDVPSPAHAAVYPPAGGAGV